jgi:hypothetical protein
VLAGGSWRGAHRDALSVGRYEDRVDPALKAIVRERVGLGICGADLVGAGLNAFTRCAERLKFWQVENFDT